MAPRKPRNRTAEIVNAETEKDMLLLPDGTTVPADSTPNAASVVIVAEEVNAAATTAPVIVIEEKPETPAPAEPALPAPTREEMIAKEAADMAVYFATLPDALPATDAHKSLLASVHSVAETHAPLADVSDADILAGMGITEQIASLMGAGPVSAALAARKLALGISEVQPWNHLRPIVQTAIDLSSIATTTRVAANNLLRAYGVEVRYDNGGYKVLPHLTAPAPKVRTPRAEKPSAVQPAGAPAAPAAPSEAGTRERSKAIDVHALCKLSGDANGEAYLTHTYMGHIFYGLLNISGEVQPADIIGDPNGTFKLVPSERHAATEQGGVFRPERGNNNAINAFFHADRDSVQKAHPENSRKYTKVYVRGEGWIAINALIETGRA